MPVMTAHEAYARRDEWAGKANVSVDGTLFGVCDIVPNTKGDGFLLRHDGHGIGYSYIVTADQLIEIEIDGEDEAFDKRLDELLTMPEGWSMSVIRRGDNGWYCTLSGRGGNIKGSSGHQTARAAIEAAKKAATEQ